MTTVISPTQKHYENARQIVDSSGSNTLILESQIGYMLAMIEALQVALDQAS